MKNKLLLLVFCLCINFSFSQRSYDTFDGCTGWCDYDKSIDIASVDVQFETCMRSCYIPSIRIKS